MPGGRTTLPHRSKDCQQWNNVQLTTLNKGLPNSGCGWMKWVVTSMLCDGKSPGADGLHHHKRCLGKFGSPCRLEGRPTSDHPIEVRESRLQQLRWNLASLHTRERVYPYTAQLTIDPSRGAFGRQRKLIWRNKDLSIKTKCVVYYTIVLSTLLHSVETWRAYKADAQRRHMYMKCRLHKILNVNRWQHIPYKFIQEKSRFQCMCRILAQCNLSSAWIY